VHAKVFIVAPLFLFVDILFADPEHFPAARAQAVNAPSCCSPACRELMCLETAGFGARAGIASCPQ
jgi:hypothetical protein